MFFGGSIMEKKVQGGVFMGYSLSLGDLRGEVDSHGGELVSFRDGRGIEYIWGGDPAVWSGRNPILFPIVGNLKNGRVILGGEEVEMSRHGFARDMEFTPVEQGEDRITLELRENEETLKKYPYPFSLRVCHRLVESGFSTSFRVKNTGSRPMPFCIGGHTAFRCPLREGERFEDYDIVFDRPMEASMRLLTADGLVSGERELLLAGEDRFPLDRTLFDRVDTIVLDGTGAEAVSLRHRENGHGVRMEFHGFPTVAFWTMGGVEGPFVCLEPWHGCAALEEESGRFEDKPGCVILAPGQEWFVTYVVFPL